MPRLRTQEIIIPIDDFSKGIVGGISERGSTRKPNWLAAADNYYGRPLRGLRIRPGSRNLVEEDVLVPASILSEQPHSLLGFYSSGGNELFVGAGASIYEITTLAYIPQTLPAGHPASSDIWTHTNLDGVLIATQRGGNLTPLRYKGTWDELKLPKPTEVITFGADAPVVPPATGVDIGPHYYRVRWRFENGSSLVGPVSAVHNVAAISVVNFLTGFADPLPVRADYIGWTLERTKVNGTAAGPFWFVKDGTGLTPFDNTPDASLGYMADEGVHGEPLHFDGLTGFTDRIFGWAGSLLHASQAANGDLEATGIANFDADLIYPVAKDDGDTIQVCIVVLDELLILKKRSVHVLSGVDPDSYILTSVVYADPARGSEAGCAGPRAACVIGGVAYFWGESGGMFTYSKGAIKPVGWIEMGRYFDDLNQSQLDSLLLVNHQGNYMLAWYPNAASNVAQDQLVRDVRLGQWWHWVGWAARDVIELKSGILGAASMAFCDPRNRVAFPNIPNGAPISGAGIPALTLVSGAVIAGATTLTMNNNATATAFNVTLTINGLATDNCNTVSGSPTVTISKFRCWAGFEFFKDEKASDGTGGLPVRAMLETPWLDYGMPDDWKDLDRLSFSSGGDLVPVTVSIATDPGGGSSGMTLTTTGTGNDWAPDVGSGVNDLEWDIGDWGSDAPTTVAGGVQSGTIGRRFKVVVTTEANGDFQPSGMEMVATLLPDKEYNI